ncbi:hypothetical protein JCM10212_000502 [Sporobolomyces blumeae]
MFALKAANRFASTSSQLCAARSALARHLSTEPSSTAEAHDVHVVQGKERERSIRKVSEEGGATAQLVALAVKNTQASTKEARIEQAKRQMNRKRSEQGRIESAERANAPAPASAPSPRRPSTGPREHSSPDRRSERGLDALSLLRGSADRRPFTPRGSPGSSRLNPRVPAGSARGPGTGGGGGGPRPPRRAGGPNLNKKGPGGGGGGANRRSGSTKKAAGSIFSPEDVKPLVPPEGVSYPRVNLAQLVRADLAAKAVQVKHAVGQGGVVGLDAAEDSDDAHRRREARKVLTGDYSNWVQGGSTSTSSSTGPAAQGQGGGDKKVKKGGNHKNKQQQQGASDKASEAVEHATSILARNPSVGLEGRKVFLDKLKESLP